MAAISHVFTIRRAAQDWATMKTCYGSCPTSSSPKTGSCGFTISMTLKPPAFTHDGIEALREIIKDQIDRAG